MEILISVFALVTSLICANYTRVNISVAYRKDIFDWYSQCIDIMMALKISNKAEKEKLSLLSKLSALIETGRYFFPNIDKGDSWGKEKLELYQGHRCHVLDYLVYYFNLYKNEEQPKTAHADIIQRLFTSAVFSVLRPKEFLKKLNFSIHDTLYSDKSREDDIQQILKVYKDVQLKMKYF